MIGRSTVAVSLPSAGVAMAGRARVVFGAGGNFAFAPPDLRALLTQALHRGGVRDAAAMLGYPLAVRGRVERGRQLGRQLGFPTANVALGNHPMPRFGVYATRTRLSDGRELGGVANLGENPTTGKVRARLEVWLFDFDEVIYDEVIETDLLHFLRDEETFVDSEGRFDVAGMSAQVRRDALDAQRWLDPGRMPSAPAKEPNEFGLQPTTAPDASLLTTARDRA